MLFAAGIFCGTHYLDIPIFWLMVLFITASFMSDFTGYFKGKWLGQKFFTDSKSRFLKKEYLKLKPKKDVCNFSYRRIIRDRL
jgi:membrane protein DedA with SNARE-associated domain